MKNKRDIIRGKPWLLSAVMTLIAHNRYHQMLATSCFGTRIGITMGTNVALMLLGLVTGVLAARWYLLIIPIYAFVGMAFHPLQGRSDFVVWNALRLGPPIGWLILLLIAIILKLPSHTLLAEAYLGVLFLYDFPVFYIVTRRISGPFRPASSKWRELLRYGLPCMFTTMPQLLNLRLDQMLMATLLPARSLGLYVVAVAWSNGLRPLLSAFGIVLFPKVASISEESARKEALAQGVRLGIISASALATPMMAVTPIFIPLLFGRDFTPAVPAALILVLASAVLEFNIVLEEGLALVQAQAMACGLPVIATTNTGAEDLFTDGVEGFIVPIRNPEAIREKVVYLYEHPEAREEMAQAALRRVQSMGGWNEYGERAAAIYQEALNRHRSGGT